MGNSTSAMNKSKYKMVILDGVECENWNDVGRFHYVVKLFFDRLFYQITNRQLP